MSQEPARAGFAPGRQRGERAPRRASEARITWAIAWRHIKESLQNRSTYVMAGFFVLLVLVLVFTALRPALRESSSNSSQVLGGLVAVFLMMSGLLPCTWSVGIAAGAFAAERERGSLIPLLATPATNRSIFAGKVLGAVLPAVGMSAIGVAAYVAEILLLFGRRPLALLPLPLTVLILALFPATSLLGAGLAGMISARVTTEQAANQYGSLILSLIWLGLFTVVLRVAAWGIGVFAAAVAAVYLVAIALILFSAATWRREEVMARQ